MSEIGEDAEPRQIFLLIVGPETLAVRRGPRQHRLPSRPPIGSRALVRNGLTLNAGGSAAPTASEVNTGLAGEQVRASGLERRIAVTIR